MATLPHCSPLSSFLRKLVADQHRGSNTTPPESVRLEIITDNAKIPTFYKRRSRCFRRSSSSESFFSATRGHVDAFESEYEASCSSKMVEQSNDAKAGSSTSRWNSLERPPFSRSSSAPASPMCPTRRTSIDEQGRENQQRFRPSLFSRSSSSAPASPMCPTRRTSIDEQGRENQQRFRPSFSLSSNAPASPMCPTRRTSIDEQGRAGNQRFPDMSLALAYLQDKYAGKQDNKTSSKATTRIALEPHSKATAPTIPTRRESIDEFYIKQAIAARTLSITEQNNCSSRDASARTEHPASSTVV